MTQTTKFPFIHFFLSLIFALLLIFLSSQKRLDFLSGMINFVATPIRLPFVVLQSKLNQQFLFLRQIPLQNRLIKDLKRQNATLAVITQKVSDLEKENQALRAQIQSPLSKNYRLLPVKIIGLNRYAIIDQGSKAGVSLNLPLVVDNIFLGLVSDLTFNTAKITLLNDPDLNLNVVTNHSTNGTVLNHQNQFELTKVLQKDPLFVDDRLFTKESETIPENLLVGTLTKIVENQSSVYQTAIYQPAKNIFEVENAFILLD